MGRTMRSVAWAGKQAQPSGCVPSPQQNGRSALLGLEPRVGLVDDIDPAAAAHDLAVAVAAFQRFERASDFHGRRRTYLNCGTAALNGLGAPCQPRGGPAARGRKTALTP